MERTSLYNRMLSRWILPFGDRLTRQRVMQYLQYYERSQFWPAERIAAETDRMVRETVATAYAEVPFYRDLYDAHGVGPSDIGGVADLKVLPVVTKAMLINADSKRLVRPTRFRTSEYSTSGSTGVPFKILIDDDSMSRARALMFQRSIFAGWSPGARTMQTGMSIHRGFLKGMKDKLLRISYVSAFDLTDEVLDGYLEIMDERRIDFLMGYSQSLYLFARRAREVGFNHRLISAVGWGSNMLRQYREALADAFGCQVFDSYGVSEGMQIAAECSAGNYHQFSLHVVAEYCRDGEPVVTGELGEILLTRTDAGAVPLIRFAVGDVGRAGDSEPCPCGRNLPLMGTIDGRTSDIVVTPNGNRLITEFFNGIFQMAQTVDSWQILQESPAAIHIRQVPREGYEPAHWDAIRNRILEMGDPDLIITMELVDEIPCEASRKRRYIKSSCGY